jgi:4-hydroxybenzoate polyprenyltransferase
VQRKAADQFEENRCGQIEVQKMRLCLPTAQEQGHKGIGMPSLEFLRPFNSVYLTVLAAAGYIVSGGSLLGKLQLVKVALAIFLLTLAANTAYELSYSKIYHIIKGGFSLKRIKNSTTYSLVAAVVLFSAGLVISYNASVYVLSLYILAAAMLAFHIFFTKDTQFLRSIFISLIAVVVVIFGTDSRGASEASYLMAASVFFSNAALDMMRVNGGTDDRTTFLVDFLKHFSAKIKFDYTKARAGASFFLAVFIILMPVPYIFGVMPLAYLAIMTLNSLIAFTALFGIVKNDKPGLHAKTASLIKINIVVTLIAFLVGALI